MSNIDTYTWMDLKSTAFTNPEDLAPTLDTLANALAAAVTMTNADQFYDGPSITLTEGTWFVHGRVIVKTANNAQNRITGKLWDGTTVWDETEVSMAPMGAGIPGYISVPFSAIITVAGNTTCKASVAGKIAGHSIASAATDNPTASTNLASRLNAIKIG